MNSEAYSYIVNNIKLPLNASHKEAFSVSKERFASIGADVYEARFSIFRRSIDARKKEDIRLVFSVCVSSVKTKISTQKLKKIDAVPFASVGEINIEYGTERFENPPLVVGSGPAGLFAALLLAECGYKPVLIERGGTVQERKDAVSRFKSMQILDSETNIQFGAGGAGTFSDGKLVTRINDPLTNYVLSRFVEFGAPEEITYLAKPHIGTDILSCIVEKMTERIEALGGTVMFHTRFEKIRTSLSSSVAVTTRGEIPYGALILAIGHSARDTYYSLLSQGFAIEPKPFSVGMRIEHLTEDIDKALYGKYAGHENLGHAEYNLSTNTKERGVYTFCMCPGGEVVPAASEELGVVVNGMSYHARAGKNSNSAVVCSVFREDYGNTPSAAIEFQRSIEKASFISGGGNYSAPITTVGDFLSDKKYAKEPSRILPTYMDNANTRVANPASYLPKFVCDGIRGALFDFDRKIKGFAASDAVLSGAETRTSAPVRILRNNETRLALGYDNVYPVGEGAGYAGGITSAAIDGIKTALAVMKSKAP